MADVTVEQLAKTVGATVERLLMQMQDAGLAHTKANQTVSSEDKQTLLAYFQNGGHKTATDPAPAAPKLSLKRKSTAVKSGSQNKRTVNIAVRKKRVYQDTSSVEDSSTAQTNLNESTAETASANQNRESLAQEEAKRQQAQERFKQQQQEIEALKTAKEEKAKADARKTANADDQTNTQETKESSITALDPEALRQKAAARRKEKQDAEKRELVIKQKAKEAKENAKREAEEKSKAEAINKKNEEANKESHLKRLKMKPVDNSEDEFKNNKKSAKPRTQRGKSRGHNIHVQLTEDGEYEETMRFGSARKKSKREIKQQAFEMPTERIIHTVEISGSIAVTQLASQMNVKVSELVKNLMNMGVMVTANQLLDEDTATLVVEEMGHNVKIISETVLEDELKHQVDDIASQGLLEPRSPVVTVMGHVDHGKTSLLDYIRSAKVAPGEAGGITQHIGAYHVETDHGMITFLDTPGHAAFTAMRARGANSTDVVILVVAADDGVMPQTEEAIQHAKAADVPLVVAVNKCDKEGADPERVKTELAGKEVIPEEWGGNVQFINVSAHTGEGIDNLLDAVLLQAELLELKAAKNIPAKGNVVESRLDKGRGAIATVLIRNGTLKQGDILLAGQSFGRIRAMYDENRKAIKEAGPSMPVEILGLNDAPEAGDEFLVVPSEKKAREIAALRDARSREERLARQQSAKLENMFNAMESSHQNVLNVIIKTDVRGSLEAIQSSLLEIGNDEVSVNIVTGGVGGITETDVNLAVTSQAVIFGFNVRADGAAKRIIEKEGIDLRYYSVIYDVIDDVKQALTGMLSPEVREEIVGVAEVRDVFNSPKFGLIAGSMVIEGTISRNKPIRVLRDNVVIYEGELESLRRFKDDVNDVRNGMECGIGVKNYQDVKAGDKIEVFDNKLIDRTL